jgi:hypothetical protein
LGLQADVSTSEEHHLESKISNAGGPHRPRKRALVVPFLGGVVEETVTPTLGIFLACHFELPAADALHRLDELDNTEDDILAYMTFPEEHWTKLHSTNVLEQLNWERGTRTRSVGIFPSDVSLLRFVIALLMEIDDDCQVDKRCMAERSMTPARAERPPLLASAAQLID